MPEGDTWPVFYAEAARVARRDVPAAAATSTGRRPRQARGAQQVDPRGCRAGARGAGAWRAAAAREPGVDLVVSPTLGARRAAAGGRRRARDPPRRSPPTRAPFSFLGWPAIAIGGLQLAGRDAATVSSAPRSRWNARRAAVASVARAGHAAHARRASMPTTWRRRCASTAEVLRPMRALPPAPTSSPRVRVAAARRPAAAPVPRATRRRPSSITSASTSTTSRTRRSGALESGLLELDDAQRAIRPTCGRAQRRSRADARDRAIPPVILVDASTGHRRDAALDVPLVGIADSRCAGGRSAPRSRASRGARRRAPGHPRRLEAHDPVLARAAMPPT